MIKISCLFTTVLMAGCSIKGVDFGALQATCTEEKALRLGEKDGSAGNSQQPGLAQESSCINKDYNESMFRKDYLSGYQRGLLQFCDPAKAEGFGRGLAKELENKEAIRDRYQACQMESDLESTLVARATQAYDQELKDQCSAISVAIRAKEAARSNRMNSNADLRKLKVCPEDVQADLAKDYQLAYAAEMELINRERELEIEKERLQLERQKLEKKNSAPNFTDFEHKGIRFEASCVLDQDEKEAIVRVRKLDGRSGSFTLSGEWKIDFYSSKDGFVTSEEEREHLYIYGDDQEDFEVSIFSSDFEKSDYCLARFMQES